MKDFSAGPEKALGNDGVAAVFEEIASLLEKQHANPFRVRAYRTAAATLRALDRPVRQILERQGWDGLTGLPGIGESLARSIDQLLHTGHLGLLDHLRGASEPERVLAAIPTIGPRLAERIHHELGIESLHELEAAAHAGRLERVPGLGPKRIRAIRDALQGSLGRWPDRPPGSGVDLRSDEPSVAELLEVDREYREKVAEQSLPRIAPYRFNPTVAAWLPVLHTERGERHYTVLYSNSARAHELGRTHDWVVLHRDDHGGDGRWTVVTARRGVLGGRRVVRGREAECEAHYGAGSG